MRRVLPLVILAALAADATPSAGEPLRFEPRQIEATRQGCGDPVKGCAHADFKYVEAAGGVDDAASRINAAIRLALGSGPERGTALPPQMYAQHFVDGYENTNGAKWYLNRTIKVLRVTPPIVSLELTEDSYAGGAHGLYNVLFLNLDPATGKEAKLDSILRPGALPRLTAVAEVYFRKVRKISPTADLKQEGFWFRDGKFQLNNNFGLTDKDLIFEYNQYEVAPYAWGPTRVVIPLADIRGLLE